MRDGRELRLIPSWERFDYVLDLLALGRPDLTGMPEYSRYRHACVVFDHIVSRLGTRAGLRARYVADAPAGQASGLCVRHG